jgi:hypothetical protein
MGPGKIALKVRTPERQPNPIFKFEFALENRRCKTLACRSNGRDSAVIALSSRALAVPPRVAAPLASHKAIVARATQPLLSATGTAARGPRPFRLQSG